MLDHVVVLQPATTQAGPGPFVVASLEDGLTYKLNDLQGNVVEGGRCFEEKDLESHDPF